MNQRRKSYPLEIVYSLDEYPFYCMSKGHHDCDTFMQAASITLGGLDGWERPRHEWWRAIPSPDHDGTVLLTQVNSPARGAYPVTVMDLDDSENTRS